MTNLLATLRCLCGRHRFTYHMTTTDHTVIYRCMNCGERHYMKA